MPYIMGVGEIRLEVYNKDGKIYSVQGDQEIDPITLLPVAENNKEVKFVCDICGAIFDKNIALAGHKRSHKEKA